VLLISLPFSPRAADFTAVVPWRGADCSICVALGTLVHLRYLLEEARSKQSNEDLELGCCTVTLSTTSCGMATSVDCLSTGGVWVTGRCTEQQCPEPAVRPCCYYTGKCEVTTEKWCGLSGGVWSTLGTDCGNAQCLSAICGFTVKDNQADQWCVFCTPCCANFPIFFDPQAGELVAMLPMRAASRSLTG
jgi:hypothetical protein